jgi:ribosome-interacting GTPase 1
LAALTRAQPNIAEYPFATTHPQPGMMQFEDVQIQLVDLPPISAEHMDSWLPNIVQGADAALLLADPSTPGTLSGIEEICERMAAVRVPLVGDLPEDADPREMPLPTVLVVTKVDAVDEDDVEVLEELYGDQYPVVRFSSESRVGHQELKLRLWRTLQLVRVYTKKPGKKVDRSDPFVKNRGKKSLVRIPL